MAQTTAIVDKMLTNVSSAVTPEGYISEMLFPQIKVGQSTGKLAKYGNQHLRITNTIMAGEGKARRVKTIVREQDSYEIDNHGLEGIVTKDDYDNVEKPYDAERDETMGLSTVTWLGKEKGLADALTDSAILTNGVTLVGSGQLSDYENSDPLGVFNAGQDTVREGSGLPANVAIMDWKVYKKVKYHPQLLESLGYNKNRPGGLSPKEMADILEVERLLIAKAVFNNSVEGQSDSLAPVWGKHIVMGYVPKVAARYQVSLGYYLTKRNEKPRQVFKYPIFNPPGAKGIIVTDNYDYFLSNVLAGYLIKDAIA